MNKWFAENFLPSLFDRTKPDKGIWLSRKQTAICVKYLEQHSTRHAQFQGDYTTHLYYTGEWNGRTVRMDYSKLNGCGMIVFGYNDEEKVELNRQHELERERMKEEHFQFMVRCAKNKPERFNELYGKAKATLKARIDSYNADVEDGEDEEYLEGSLVLVEEARARVQEFERAWEIAHNETV